MMKIKMFKKRYHSVHNDFKTGILCKITIFGGIILLIIYVLITLLSFIFGSESSGFLNQIYSFSQSSYMSTILAFSILMIGASIILYFFSCQFAKLSEIAKDIENEVDLSNKK